ncbi:heme-binding domain-containing protein [Terriglobus roseus]|uniref:Cytochrome c n=1 Tax=Terriglobus roseus TaxID=392734 RepID=A0A1G7K8Z1_9BACT|nr:heme-binding domain-containing protein [Terriglobus roseus]SDF33635.1 cytochrome c [Terriglobus roseus]
MKYSIVLIVLLVTLVIGLGLFHPFGNPRVEPSKGLDTLLTHASMPEEAKAVLIAKCANCHSNETRWPIYARLAPGSWLMERDVVEARKKMNLSLWDQMSPDDQQVMIGKIIHEAKNGEMAPLQYLILHWESQLTPVDIAALAGMQADTASQVETHADGDAARGKLVFQKRCTGCHAVGGNREGPPLAGVFGSKAGSVAGFRYSEALHASGITWNEATLEKWLNDPDTVVPGNQMDFHLPKAQERADVIAYFKRGL